MLIGRRSGGKARGSPKGAINRVRMDVEAVGKQAEVPSGRGNAMEWTSKLGESMWKSKVSEKTRWIGRRSRVEISRSPIQHNITMSEIPKENKIQHDTYQ